MHSKLFGEFMGTMILILLGNGVVAGVLLNKSKAQNAGWIAITAGWAFAVMCGVFTSIACGSSGAHLNPAVTVGAAVASGDFSNLSFIAAQLAGAMAGALLVYLYYLPHFDATPDPDLKFACFGTAPAIRNIGSNLLSEALGTFVLLIVIAAFNSKSVGTLSPGYSPYLVGLLVWSIGLSLGGTTGYAINPARDLGPRIMHALLPIRGKGATDWGYAAVPVIGPLIGAVGAGLFMRALGL
jgi:glycerol uptake facilitator protein